MITFKDGLEMQKPLTDLAIIFDLLSVLITDYCWLSLQHQDLR
jgi:hypothetical protein